MIRIVFNRRPMFDGELFIKLTGTYSSWGNSEWDTIEIVKRKQKTIYVYE